MEQPNLFYEANQARLYAYAPYSHFQVGAALLTKTGKIFHGCNVENVSYGLTNCAERTAIFKAISEGETKFEKIAIIADCEQPIPPCGACRQVITEFMEPGSEVLMYNLKGDVLVCKVSDLLPGAFQPTHLNK